jgi:hypothetical protein
VNGRQTVLAAAVLIAATVSAQADRIKNGNFEATFEVIDDMARWGGDGEVFGGARQVTAGEEGHPARAKAGRKCVVIDLSEQGWNGLWQEIPGRSGMNFTWKASVLIQGGDLPDTVATFLKVEFYDQHGEYMSAVEGKWYQADTKGKWVESVLKGTTPEGTKTVRFVIIAGENSENAEVKNRIYWDDASAL